MSIHNKNYIERDTLWILIFFYGEQKIIVEP